MLGLFLNLWPHLIVPKDGRLSSELPHDGKWNQPDTRQNAKFLAPSLDGKYTVLVVREPHVSDSRFCVPVTGSADVEHGPRLNSERQEKLRTNCTPRPRHHT